MGRYFKDFIRAHKKGLLVIFACIFFSVLISMPAPMITKYLFDHVLVSGNYSLAFPLASLFLLVMAAQLSIGRLYAWIMSGYMQDFINEMRVNLVSMFLRANASCKISAGNLVVIINSDIPWHN